MERLTTTDMLLLDNAVHVMAAGRRGLVLASRPLLYTLRRVWLNDIVAYLRRGVEHRTSRHLTVRMPALGLLHHYGPEQSIPLVTCRGDQPEGEVSDPGRVQHAWFLVAGGLLPAAFDGVPKDGAEFVRRMQQR